MSYLKEQTDGEAMINFIKNGDQPLPRVTQVSLAGTSSTGQPPLKDKSMWSDQEKKIYKIDCLARSLLIQGLPNDIYSLIDNNKTAKDLWDTLARHMLGSEYGEQDRKVAVLYEYETFKATEGELLLDTYIRYLQYETMMRQNKNLLNINIDALYNILKQNQGDVNDPMKSKKKAVVITFGPFALVAEQTKVRKRKVSVVVSSESEGSDDELKKITALLVKAFNRKKFYSKPTNNNLRTSSATSLANKKQEYMKFDNKKEEKKVDEKKRDMSKVKCYNCKKEGHFVKDCKKAKVKDYEYYKTKMLLAKKDKDEQVLLAEDQAWIESNVTHNDSKDVSKLINKMIKEFDKKIAKYRKRLKKVNQQSKDFKNQIKFLQERCDVLQYQTNTFEVKKNELKEQIKVLFEKNNDFLAQTKALQEQLKVKHVVIDNHVECQAKYAKLEAERYEYMIRYSAYFDNDKQYRKQITDQEILFEKMSHQLVEMNNNVLRLQEKILEKETNISELEGCVRRPMHSGVIWKKKGSSNTSNIDLSSISHLKLNKDVNRYSRKDLLLCNNSHLGETSSAYVCNDAINISCNSRLYDSFDENNLFIFDNESVRNSQVSKMPFRKKPNASLNVPSRSKVNKSLPRIVRKWLPKLQPLAEPICLWIIDSGCSKHMTGNHALLTNFVEKFLGTVRFGNNDFAMIAGYGNVCNPLGSGFSFLLAVVTFFTGSGNFFCQWELYNWQWECLVHFILNNPPLNLML
nr:hypothetical protein [Tanacetum cinerariifolium]